MDNQGFEQKISRDEGKEIVDSLTRADRAKKRYRKKDDSCGYLKCARVE